MSRYLTCFAIACIVAAGAACTSAPVRYYTLTPPPQPDGPPAASTPAIEVRLVHPMPLLHRAELMIRRGQTEVMLLENEQWATPLDDEIKNALRVEVQRRLSDKAAPVPNVTKLLLAIDVQHFDAELGRYVLLEVSWTAAAYSTAGQSAAWTATCAFRAEERIDAGYPRMVAGYQREIAALAAAIVAALTRSTDATYAPCH
jgi:uncharacterized lipoprotein YmbA